MTMHRIQGTKKLDWIKCHLKTGKIRDEKNAYRVLLGALLEQENWSKFIDACYMPLYKTESLKMWKT